MLGLALFIVVPRVIVLSVVAPNLNELMESQMFELL